MAPKQEVTLAQRLEDVATARQVIDIAAMNYLDAKAMGHPERADAALDEALTVLRRAERRLERTRRRARKAAKETTWMADIPIQPTQDQIDAITRLENAGWRLDGGPFRNVALPSDVRVFMKWIGSDIRAIHEYTISADGRVRRLAVASEQYERPTPPTGTAEAAAMLIASRPPEDYNRVLLYHNERKLTNPQED